VAWTCCIQHVVQHVVHQVLDKLKLVELKRQRANLHVVVRCCGVCTLGAKCIGYFTHAVAADSSPEHLSLERRRFLGVNMPVKTVVDFYKRPAPWKRLSASRGTKHPAEAAEDCAELTSLLTIMHLSSVWDKEKKVDLILTFSSASFFPLTAPNESFLVFAFNPDNGRVNAVGSRESDSSRQTMHSNVKIAHAFYY